MGGDERLSADKDFEQSGKLRSENKDLLLKYILGVLSYLGGYFWIYKQFLMESNVDHGLMVALLSLSFVSFLALIYGVTLYSEQLLVSQHHIRNQAAHRLSLGLSHVLSLKGINLFSRQRSVGGQVKYFIPNWTTRADFALVIFLIVIATLPILSSYFFWSKLELNSVLGVILFAFEVFIGLWIIERRLGGIFAPLITSRVVTPDNPIPAPSRSPSVAVPLEDNLRTQFARRLRLFSITASFLAITVFAVYVSFSETTANVLFPDPYPHLLLASIPYILMVFYTIHINRFYFDREFFRHNKISLVVPGAIIGLGLAFFYICIGFALLSLMPYKGNSLLLFILHLIVIAAASLYSWKVAEGDNLKRRKAIILSILWILISTAMMIALEGKRFVPFSRIDIDVPIDAAVIVPLFILITLTLFLKRMPIDTIKIAPGVSSIGIATFLFLIWRLSTKHMSLAYLSIQISACVVFAGFLWWYIKRLAGHKSTAKLRCHWVLLPSLAIICAGIMMEYKLAPWVLLSVLLVMRASYRIFMQQEESTKMVSFCAIVVSLLAITYFNSIFPYDSTMAHLFSTEVNTLDLPAGVKVKFSGQLTSLIIPGINVALWIVACSIVFFVTGSSLFALSDYRQLRRTLLPIDQNAGPWPQMKWSIAKSKRSVMTHIRLGMIGGAILIAYWQAWATIPLLFLFGYLTISSLAFEIELTRCLLWKTEYQGMHLLADDMLENPTVVGHINALFRKHGVSEEDLLHVTKGKTPQEALQKLSGIIRDEIDKSYLTLLLQRMNHLFIVNHRAPKKPLDGISVLGAHLRWLDLSNPLKTILWTPFLLPWAKEMSLMFDGLSNLTRIRGNRAEGLTNTPLHSSSIISDDKRRDITILLSSESTAGQDKLASLAEKLRDYQERECNKEIRSIQFIGISGGDAYDRVGIPYLYAQKETGSDVIGIVGKFTMYFNNLLRLYPAGHILRLRPDMVILSDSSFLNTMIAAMTKKINRDISVVYYSPPQSEIYTFLGDRRADIVVEECDLIGAISGQQLIYYLDIMNRNERKPDIVDVGLPQIERLAISEWEQRPFERYGFLPGSRASEWEWSFEVLKKVIAASQSAIVNAILPNEQGVRELLKTLGEKPDNLRIFMIARPNDRSGVNYNSALGVEINLASMQNFLEDSDRIIAVSGTAATEAAFARPTKIIYKVTKLNALMAYILRAKGNAIVNGVPKSVSSLEFYTYHKQLTRKGNAGRDNDNPIWHFTLVNWLLQRHDEVGNPMPRVCERVIFWDEDENNLTELVADLLSNNDWPTDDQMIAIRKVLREELVPEEDKSKQVIQKIFEMLEGIVPDDANISNDARR